jgi:uncharacterized protein (TIGR02145 family)
MAEMKRIVNQLSIILIAAYGFVHCKCNQEEANPEPQIVINPPQVETLQASAISDTSASCGGRIQADGSIKLVAGGLCWNTLPNPDLKNGQSMLLADSGTFTTSIRSLKASTRYFMRAFAIWNSDTSYGNQIEFSTADLCDVEGNTYKSVKIGSQIWMKENLKVRHFRNGDPINNIQSPIQWKSWYHGAYADYNNDAEYSKVNGICYNGYILADPRGLCPTGWHIPSNEEWLIMENFLGGSSVAGGKIKTTGSIDKGDGPWYPPNFNATNSSGFSALPAGHRNMDGSFHEDGKSAYWWTSSTIPDNYNGTVKGMDYYMESIYTSNERFGNGYTIRCLKD